MKCWPRPPRCIGLGDEDATPPLLRQFERAQPEHDHLGRTEPGVVRPEGHRRGTPGCTPCRWPWRRWHTPSRPGAATNGWGRGEPRAGTSDGTSIECGGATGRTRCHRRRPPRGRGSGRSPGSGLRWRQPRPCRRARRRAGPGSAPSRGPRVARADGRAMLRPEPRGPTRCRHPGSDEGWSRRSVRGVDQRQDVTSRTQC